MEIKRFLNADPDDMRQGWESRKEREWHARYCSDEAWREAIDNGWIRCRLSLSAADHITKRSKCASGGHRATSPDLGYLDGAIR